MADRWDALARAIHFRRRELGIRSQAAAAALAGVSLNTWSRAECGHPVSYDSLRAIATALQWDPKTPMVILRGADTSTPPLTVIPLTAGLEISAAVLEALARAWEERHGQVLTTGDMTTETTVWGPCMVVRAPREARS